MVLVLVSCSKESDSGQSYSPSTTPSTSSQTASTNITTTVPVPVVPYEEGDYIWKNLTSSRSLLQR